MKSVWVTLCPTMDGDIFFDVYKKKETAVKEALKECKEDIRIHEADVEPEIKDFGDSVEIYAIGAFSHFDIRKTELK